MTSRKSESRCDAYRCLAHGIAHASNELEPAALAGILGSIALDIVADPEGWQDKLAATSPFTNGGPVAAALSAAG